MEMEPEGQTPLKHHVMMCFFFYLLFFYVWHFSWCCQAIIFWSFCTGISHPLNLFDKKYAFLQEDTTFFLLTYVAVFCINTKIHFYYLHSNSNILYTLLRNDLQTFLHRSQINVYTNITSWKKVMFFCDFTPFILYKFTVFFLPFIRNW